MAEELATLPKAPEMPKTGRLGFKEALGVSEPFLQRKAEMQPQIAAAEGDIAKAKQVQSEVLAGGKMAAQEKFGKEEAAARGAYEGKLEAEPLPAFIPTKDTVQDIAGLFSVIGVIGMLVGGGGKMAGQRAMGAMNGMMEGYRKGRSDLYKQQRNEFDANFKTMLQKHQEFRKEMDDAVKLASTNKEAGMAAAELAASKAGSDIVKAQLRRGDLMGAYKLVDESEKGAVHAFDTVAKQRENEAKEIAAAQRHKEDMAQRERQHRESLAAQAARAELKAGAGGSMPKDAKTKDEHRFRHSAIENVKDVLEDIKDPEIRRLIGPENQYMPDVILNLQDKYPALAQKLARFQSQEFQIGGKNLTQSEQKILNPIYGWRNLTAKALEDNLNEASRAMFREQKYLEGMYPGLGQINYEGSVGAPAAVPAPSGKPIPTEADKARARSNPESRANFVRHFGVEP
jgi:hypothetical protein